MQLCQALFQWGADFQTGEYDCTLPVEGTPDTLAGASHVPTPAKTEPTEDARFSRIHSQVKEGKYLGHRGVPILFIYQARESSLVPAGFLTAQFLQKM